MGRKRRVFSAGFKAEVALAAFRGDKTTAELSKRWGPSHAPSHSFLFTRII